MGAGDGDGMSEDCIDGNEANMSSLNERQRFCGWRFLELNGFGHIKQEGYNEHHTSG